MAAIAPGDPGWNQLGDGYAVATPGGFTLTERQPIIWSTEGTTTTTGNSVSKPTGAAAWDSSAFLTIPYQAVTMSWTVPDKTTSYFGGGLATSPATSPSFQTLTMGFFMQAGSLAVYENGNLVYNALGNFYSAGDVFAISYDGNQVNYLHNDRVIYFDFNYPGLNVFPMFSIFTVGTQIQNIVIV